MRVGSRCPPPARAGTAPSTGLTPGLGRHSRSRADASRTCAPVEECRPLHQMAQLADVARPGVAQQPGLGRRPQVLGTEPVPRRITREKLPRQIEDILPPRPQRGQFQEHHRQAVVQVQAKASSATQALRSACVAAMSLTSTACSATAPSRRTRFSSMALAACFAAAAAAHRSRPRRASPRRGLEQARLGALGIGEGARPRSRRARPPASCPGWRRS